MKIAVRNQVVCMLMVASCVNHVSDIVQDCSVLQPFAFTLTQAVQGAGLVEKL